MIPVLRGAGGDPTYRYMMPEPVLRHQGKGYKAATVVENAGGIARALGVPPDAIVAWLADRHASRCTGDRVFGPPLTVHQVREDLWELAALYIECPLCGVPECVLRAHSSRLSRKCTACGSRDRDVSGVHPFSRRLHRLLRRAA